MKEQLALTTQLPIYKEIRTRLPAVDTHIDTTTTTERRGGILRILYQISGFRYQISERAKRHEPRTRQSPHSPQFAPPSALHHDVSTGQKRFPTHNGLPRRGLPG
jgi:hypothetical protein